MMNRCSLLLILLIVSCTSGEDKETATRNLIGFKIHSTFPHDTAAFTEGLLVHEGKLWESTGEHGKSWIGVVDIKTGKANRKIELDEKYFGEGFTILNDKVYQLTYKAKTGFVYSLDSFKLLREFSYPSEGWGLTHNGTELVMSNGSDELLVLDTGTLEITRKINVTHNGQPVNQLNELEYVNGAIYANIYLTNLIAKINPENGKVEGFLDLAELTAHARRTNARIDVLNGIAWYAPTQSLLVTGKYWPFVYALKLEEK